MTRLPYTLLALITSFVIGEPGPARAFWPFVPKRFKANALIDAGALGFENFQGRLIAFGDFDGNQFMDLVSLSTDQRTARVHLWNHDSFQFTLSGHHTLNIGKRIVNVVPGDFNRDGKLDLLVMSEMPNHPDGLDMALYLAGPQGFMGVPPIDLKPATRTQPLPFDAFGQMKIDLLGFLQSPSGETAYLLWNNTRTDPSITDGPFFNVVDAPFKGAYCEVSNPHSNAVVDFDGDCLSDVFLMCGTVQKSYQIWTNSKDKGFVLKRRGPFPKNIGAVSFADINRDGTIDMVFPSCESISDQTGIGTNCQIHVVYNQQKPLCASTSPTASQGDCRMPDQLCSADSKFSFDFDSSEGHTTIDVASLLPDGANSLLLYDTSSPTPIPIALRAGDLDLDGFPDLVPIVVHKDGSRTPHVLINEPCSHKRGRTCGSSIGRSFKLLPKNAEALERIKDASSVALLDIDEDGTWDIMVQRSGLQSGQKVTFIQNNFFHDAFFLKAIVLNGACSGLCTPLNSTGPRYHPFGVSYSGPTYKYTILDTSGQRSAAQVPQLPQTSYQALHTPYTFFGLGRTNNYIENLFVGSTQHQSQHYINMEGVIPNSRVVIVPPSSRLGEETSIQDWRRELYLRPGEWIPWVTLTVVVATIMLAAIVFFLHLNEKREDELERKRKLHHINFDAL